jgi:hypothetical protein
VPASDCATEVQTTCNRDPFWSVGQPFAVLPGTATDDQNSRCSASVLD